MSKASRETLERIHEAMATALSDALENGETIMTKEGVERVSVRPATLAVAAKFLKDNGVAGFDLGEERLGDLAERIKGMVEDTDGLSEATGRIFSS